MPMMGIGKGEFCNVCVDRNISVLYCPYKSGYY